MLKKAPLIFLISCCLVHSKPEEPTAQTVENPLPSDSILSSIERGKGKVYSLELQQRDANRLHKAGLKPSDILETFYAYGLDPANSISASIYDPDHLKKVTAIIDQKNKERLFDQKHKDRLLSFSKLDKNTQQIFHDWAKRQENEGVKTILLDDETKYNQKALNWLKDLYTIMQEINNFLNDPKYTISEKIVAIREIIKEDFDTQELEDARYADLKEL